MSEFQLFCWSEKYGDNNSKQQKAYRVFNKEVGESRYEELLKQIGNIIPNPNKLKHDDFWKSLTNNQIYELSQIPEFDEKGFEFITGRKVENHVMELTIDQIAEKSGVSPELIKIKK